MRARAAEAPSDCRLRARPCRLPRPCDPRRPGALMSTPTLPAYVDLDGGIVIRPPYQQTSTFLSAWLVSSDKAAQQRLLDTAFNIPSQGAVDYRALTSPALVR